MLLQGVTAIRVKAGLTQLALARYLGISKSLVSMVENQQRKLPLTALMKLSELEIRFREQPVTGIPFQVPVYTESEAEVSVRNCKVTIKRCQLNQLQYQLENMEELHKLTLAAFMYLERMQVCGPVPSVTSCGNSFDVEKKKLQKQLKRCDATARAGIRGKIAMLEIVLQSYEPEIKVTDTAQAGEQVDKAQIEMKDVTSDMNVLIKANKPGNLVPEYRITWYPAVGHSCGPPGMEVAA